MKSAKGLTPLFLFLMVMTAPAHAQFEVWRKVLGSQGLCIGINPLNPSTIYTQGNDNRLMVSRDRGSTWTTFGPAMPFELREILIHPRDSLTMLAANFGDGLLRSTDGGASWTIVLSGYGIDGESFTFDPNHPDTLFAGNFADAAVFRSTNRGAGWTLQGHAGIGTDLCALAVRPDSGNILYAGTGNGTISKSTDFGQHWHLVKSGGSQEIPRIVINPSNPQIAYGAAYAGADSARGVWKTTDGGEHWFLAGLQFISQWAIDLDPRHPDTVYTGTFSLYSSTIYRSVDGGTSWSPLSEGLLPFNSAWNLKIDPLDAANVYVGLTSGDFGANGVFKLANADAGIQGIVLDSLTSQPITSGSLFISPPGVTVSLDLTSGVYSFFRFDGDTVSSLTFSVTVNSDVFLTEKVALSPGVILDHDLLVSPGSISGTVFHDLNRNGIRDAGEPGLANWKVLLTGTKNLSALSDLSGHYVFPDLFAGSYTVADRPRYGWVETTPPPQSYTFSLTSFNRNPGGADFGNTFSRRVVSMTPQPNSGNIGVHPVITAVFDTAMDAGSFSDTATMIVRSSLTGIHRGLIEVGNGGTTATFVPVDSFRAGELVTVDCTDSLRTADGSEVTPFSAQFTVAVPPGGGGFTTPSAGYPVASLPWAVAAADLDHDGDIDIVVSCSAAHAASVLLNNGDGTFAPRVDYAVGASPRSVALGDIDGDGNIDMVVGNSGASTVTLWKNNGDGTFSSRVGLSAGGSPSSVSLADVDGDGSLDIIVTNAGQGTVSVLFNDGHGFFSSPTPFSCGTAPASGSVGDFNNDGGLDVAVANSTDAAKISLLTNSGQGVIGLSSTVPVGLYPRSVLGVDLNNDLKLDLVAANTNSSSLSVYLQDAGETFGNRTDVPTGTDPWSLAAGDLNGDGFIDVCAADVLSGGVSVMTNDGAGGFKRRDMITGSNPYGVAIADVDNDGDLDIVAANSALGNVVVLLNGPAIGVVNGWNMVAVPIAAPGFAKSFLYPAAVTKAFGYDGSYQAVDTVRPGSGYWLKFPADTTIYYGGKALIADTIDVRGGWNMIGGPARSIPADAVGSIPDGIVSSRFFGYTGSYQVALGIEPGAGYWVKTSQAGKLILTPGRSSLSRPPAGDPRPEAISTLTFTSPEGRKQALRFSSVPVDDRALSGSDLPPVPPPGGFDVRYASQRFLESGGGKDGEFPIAISSPGYPLNVSWNVQPGHGALFLRIGETMVALAPGSGSIVLADPSLKATLVFRAGEQAVPAKFSLGQNYPNPFNPVTRIQFSVASPQLVTLRVFDVLGREVTTLVNEAKPPGEYSVEWDAANRPSGVYYYRMTAGAFTETRKLAVIR